MGCIFSGVTDGTYAIDHLGHLQVLIVIVENSRIEPQPSVQPLRLHTYFIGGHLFRIGGRIKALEIGVVRVIQCAETVHTGVVALGTLGIKADVIVKLVADHQVCSELVPII